MSESTVGVGGGNTAVVRPGDALVLALGPGCTYSKDQFEKLRLVLADRRVDLIVVEGIAAMAVITP